ncbi:hypothetical protein CHS0354_027030 [Potamilus streckersoni]|uniref:Uncharacterized protein n=1 Tax=Potamilus streckersoni TaxID=2493646 RepID=A0AAE0TIW3_9BIVA|nr:hypothetical protein CHS0354_027030 [Potamilus streckersoni]
MTQSNSTTEAVVTCMVTENGKRKLVASDGFTYAINRENKGTEWRCSIRNKLRVKAVHDLFDPTQNIVDCVLQEHIDVEQSEVSRPHYNNMSGENMKQELLVFIVMSGKNKKDYKKTSHNQLDTVFKFCRKVFALPFLLAEHIPTVFEKLKGKVTNSTLD